MFIDTRSEFIFKDPDALDALLHYDWRTRRVLTDTEVVGSPDRPGAVEGADGSPSLLRHMQRLRCLTAVHGVRRQGGRMRLWRIEEVLKLQIVLDLRVLTGHRLSTCAELFSGPFAGIATEAVEGWYDHIGATPEPVRAAKLKRYNKALMGDRAELTAAVERSVRNFVVRNRFDAVEAPAFLL